MKQNHFLRWYSIPFGFRVRILVVYCLLILLSFSGAIFAIRRVLLLRLEERIEQGLNQEVKELYLLVQGRDPDTAQPFGKNITAIFKVFLRRNIPTAHEYLIALLPDRFYDSSPPILPQSINKNSNMVQYWQKLTESERGEIETLNNQIVYLAEPVKIDGKVLGVFVVAIATAHERREIDHAILIIIQVAIVVIISTSILAWILAGRILAPLRLLTSTARAISETDLERRIPVKGNDEIAKLGMTFNEMLNRLQSAFTNQKRFLNDVGHELRTPITIIQGHLELMGDTPEEQRETQEVVTDELERMSRLITDLMLLAKSEQPDFLHLETFQIRTLTEEMYARAKVLAERNWQIDQIGSGLIEVDRQRVIQAITNLAQNATKHTQITDTIAIGSLVTQDYVRFWVRDTGTGIPLTEQAQIFERFVRGSNNRSSESMGLGLSIVKAIVQAHGGKVELFSRPGEGSKFTLVLPLDSPVNHNQS